MRNFLTAKIYNKGWGNGFREGWGASLGQLKEMLQDYKEMEEGFSEYQSAMDDAIELIDHLSGNKSEKLDT